MGRVGAVKQCLVEENWEEKEPKNRNLEGFQGANDQLPRTNDQLSPNDQFAFAQ